MSRPNLRKRIPGALALAPMTKTQLANCLSCTYSRVDQLIQEMHKQHRVRIVGGVKRGNQRPDWLWGLT